MAIRQLEKLRQRLCAGADVTLTIANFANLGKQTDMQQYLLHSLSF